MRAMKGEGSTGETAMWRSNRLQYTCKMSCQEVKWPDYVTGNFRDDVVNRKQHRLQDLLFRKEKLAHPLFYLTFCAPCGNVIT